MQGNVHSLGQVILRLQHTLLQTFSAEHCKVLQKKIVRMLFSQKKLFNFKYVKICQILTGYKTYFVRLRHSGDSICLVMSFIAIQPAYASCIAYIHEKYYSHKTYQRCIFQCQRFLLTPNRRHENCQQNNDHSTEFHFTS